MFSPGEISVIKIDVEGFEPFVLSGAHKLLNGQDVKIISEYCPPAMLEAGASLVTFLEQLIQWGLQAYEPGGAHLEWAVLLEDARKWEQFGRERLFAACKEKSNPEIAAFVEQQAGRLGCTRPISKIWFSALRGRRQESSNAHCGQRRRRMARRHLSTRLAARPLPRIAVRAGWACP